jgi:hypothetical protein
MKIHTEPRETGIRMVYRDGTLIGSVIRQGELRKWRTAQYVAGRWSIPDGIYIFPYRTAQAAIDAVVAA